MSNETIYDDKMQSSKQLAWWLYLFHGASLVFGLGMLSWIPLIVSYLKRNDTAGTFVFSHHTWQIRTFWWSLGWCALGYLLMLTLVGIPLALLIWFATWIWAAYRLVKGFLDLNDNKPVGAYATPGE